MVHRVKYLLVGILLTASSFAFAGQKAAPAASGTTAFDRVVDRVIAREAGNNKTLRSYTPLVETYLQSMKADRDVGMVPVNDQYYLTRVGFKKSMEDINFHAEPGFLSRALHGATKNFRTEFVSSGFNWMMTMDMRGLDREHYSFDYQGREFLGDLRCIVIDVTPKSHSGTGRFLGRVWVEDKDFNIVRFNGTFQASARNSYLHFDTWRLNMEPGVWLPAYIYSEDLEAEHAKSHSGNYKAETRIWGYNVGKGHAENEFTEVLVDDSSAIKDNSETAQDLPPVAAERAWQRQAEDNVVERLEHGGLLARTGEVDRVLNTVVNNLEITNNIDIQPEVRCRVLLTSPIESFSMGHTIFVSRGMLDVLPDETSLAAVLAHELAHIVLGHPTDTSFAFKDRSIVSDQKLLARMHFSRTQAEEREADTKALALLLNSPYKDKLDSVGLFLRQVDARRGVLPHLIRSDMGNSLITGSGGDLRLTELIKSAPKLDPKKVTQVAALPLGGRIKVDPWNNRIEINKSKPVQLLTAREKMPLEITPVFPHLTRLTLETPAEAPKPAPDSKATQPAPDQTPAAIVDDTTAAK
jgi:Peptidase family M48